MEEHTIKKHSSDSMGSEPYICVLGQEQNRIDTAILSLQSAGFSRIQQVSLAEAQEGRADIYVLCGSDFKKLSTQLETLSEHPRACLLLALDPDEFESKYAALPVDEIFSVQQKAYLIGMRVLRGLRCAKQRGHRVVSSETASLCLQRNDGLGYNNDFLVKLVASAVDAIIAVDMRGIVILFNSGAETLFGHRAIDVVGVMPIEQLYPERAPKEIMQMLRGTGFGGAGRLEKTRRKVVIKDGSEVPVSMTAAMIYQDGKEVASVGIFSDLRGRLRTEEHLFKAQEKIKSQEQSSLLAQLAGATAHELNQPLTSIMGYIALMRRTIGLDKVCVEAETSSSSQQQKSSVPMSKEDESLRHKQDRYTKTILEEAERMADIVKKIGRITKFETVSYIGATDIVDLDRSIEASEAVVVPVLVVDDE